MISLKLLHINKRCLGKALLKNVFCPTTSTGSLTQHSATYSSIGAHRQQHRPLLQIPNVVVSRACTFFDKFLKPDEKKLRRKDKVHRSDVLVYSNGYMNQLKMTYIGTGLLLIPVFCNTLYISLCAFGHWPAESQFSLMDQDHPLYFHVVGSALGLSLLFSMRMLLVRCFSRIYLEPEHERFTGISQNFAFDRRVVVFTQSDVKPKEGSSVVGETFGNYNIKGQPFLVLAKDFRSPKYYALFKGAYSNDHRTDS